MSKELAQAIYDTLGTSTPYSGPITGAVFTGLNEVAKSNREIAQALNKVAKAIEKVALAQTAQTEEK